MKTMEISCPNCGKKHTIQIGEVKWFYLDGMHDLPVSDFVKSMALCECGLLCVANIPENIDVKRSMQTRRYQNALATQYSSETEKKLALFDAMYFLSGKPLYYAHHYHEIGENDKKQEVLKNAIHAIETEQDMSPYYVCGAVMRSVHNTENLILLPELRLIDLYRCTRQFKKASQQVRIVKNLDFDTPAVKEYLQVEDKLIRERNSSFM